MGKTFTEATKETFNEFISLLKTFPEKLVAILFSCWLILPFLLFFAIDYFLHVDFIWLIFSSIITLFWIAFWLSIVSKMSNDD